MKYIDHEPYVKTQLNHDILMLQEQIRNLNYHHKCQMNDVTRRIDAISKNIDRNFQKEFAWNKLSDGQDQRFKELLQCVKGLEKVVQLYGENSDGR